MFYIILKNDPYKDPYRVLSVDTDHEYNNRGVRVTYTQFMIYKDGFFTWVNPEDCNFEEVRDA